MYTDSQIQDWILERDGSTRDVTFMPVERVRVFTLLQHLLADYKLVSVSDNDGNDRLKDISNSTILDGRSGYLHMVLDSGMSLIRRLQAFVDWGESEAGYCVEISFFPDELDMTKFSLAMFQDLIEEWNSVLESPDYFVRFENASWKPYDTHDLGVIYTRMTHPRTNKMLDRSGGPTAS